MKKGTIVIGVMAFLISLSMLCAKAYAAEKDTVDYGGIAELLLEELKNENLSSEEEVLNAINEAEEKYNVDISEKNKEKVAKAVVAVNNLGLDKEKLTEMVGDVYENVIKDKTYKNTDELVSAVEKQVMDKVAEGIKDTVNKGISDYINDFSKRMKDFADKITSLWSK